MKKGTLILFSVIFCLASTVHAQFCMPNPAYTHPGIYPDTATNLSPGCRGEFYLQDFTLVVPHDTVVAGLTFTITYMRVDSVVGLPPGLTYACNPPNCTFPGNSSGCINLYGVPPTIGTYNLVVYVSGQASNPFFGSFNIPLSYSGYRLRVGAAPSLTSGTTQATCLGADGTAWVQATGPVSYTYSWSTTPPTANDTAFNLSPDIYIATVSDALGCASTDTVTVTSIGGPVIDSVVKTNVLCNGGSTGTANVFVSGGNPGYTFSWNHGPATSSVTGLSATTYTVTVTDQLGCQASALVNITQPFPLSAGATHTDLTCNGTADGTASAFPSGGTFPYSYSWSNGGNNYTIAGLIAGAYTVTVTDAHSCLATSTVTVTSPAAINIVSSHTDVSCHGGTDGTSSLAVSGGSSGYTYLWNNGDTTVSVSGLSAGTYTVSVTDMSGCTGTASVVITEPPQLNVSAAAQNISCAGSTDGTVTATPSGGTPGYTYSWSNGGSTATITNLGAGSYTVTATDAHGCTATTSASVTTPSPISITLSGTNETLVGANDGAVNATVSGGTSPYTFSWNNGASTEDISGLAGGTYTLQVTDDNGCTQSGTVTIITVSGTGVENYFSGWKIYPNPAGDILTVSSENAEADAHVSLYDLAGKCIRQEWMTTVNLTLHLEGLPAGTYVLEIVKGEASGHYRIIKQ